MVSLWIVGLAYHPDDAERADWSFIGVFDSEEAAVAACTTPSHFVGPVVLNERLPDEPEAWPGAYYPLAAKGE